MTQILIVDDEPAIRESLAFALGRDGFATCTADRIAAARELAPAADFVILDLMLPDGNGIDLLRDLRRTSRVPVLVLSSRDEEADRVTLLEMGADDYVVKPFSPREVVARVRAVLRRLEPCGPEASSPLSGPAGVTADAGCRRAWVSGREVPLSRLELDLLLLLLGAPDRVFERGQLLDSVWGRDAVVGERTVDTHIKTLRKKLAAAGAPPDVVEAVRGVGYRLRAAQP